MAAQLAHIWIHYHSTIIIPYSSSFSSSEHRVYTSSYPWVQAGRAAWNHQRLLEGQEHLRGEGELQELQGEEEEFQAHQGEGVEEEVHHLVQAEGEEEGAEHHLVQGEGEGPEHLHPAQEQQWVVW